MAASHVRVLIDTSAFAALADKSDMNHQVARVIWEWVRRERMTPFTTNFVVAETHALLVRRASPVTARHWLLAVPVPEVWVTEEDYARGRRIIETHRDKTYTLTDTTSFMVMERLGAHAAFSFDQHFDQYGFRRLDPPGAEVMR